MSLIFAIELAWLWFHMYFVWQDTYCYQNKDCLAHFRMCCQYYNHWVSELERIACVLQVSHTWGRCCSFIERYRAENTVSFLSLSPCIYLRCQELWQPSGDITEYNNHFWRISIISCFRSYRTWPFSSWVFLLHVSVFSHEV